MSQPGSKARCVAAAVFVSLLSAGARADTFETAEAPAPAADELPGWAVVVERDARAMWAGSPVALRAQVRARRQRALSQRQHDELTVFRETQTGAFDALIADAAETWGIGPFLLKGLLFTESRLDPRLVGKRIYQKVRGRRTRVGGGARGIAQFTTEGVAALNEARQRRHRDGERVAPLRSNEVWNPRVAIPAAAELLRHYMERFGRDGGITAYNTGPYGGRLVKKLGFFRAKREGKLSRVRDTALQGHKFLLNVLRHTNRYRDAAGLRPLPGPDRERFERVRDQRRPKS